MGFADAGVVDTVAVPATKPGRGSTFLYEGGLGLVTRHQLRDLDWTLRFEVPFVVAPFQFAADSVSGKARLALRWQTWGVFRESCALAQARTGSIGPIYPRFFCCVRSRPKITLSGFV